MQKLTFSAAAILLALPLSAAPALAAGGGTTEKCKTGEKYDEATKKCVVASLDQLEDERIYGAGRELALAGRYDEAIRVLSGARNKNDARILNYLGYSHRKLGRMTVGLGYYQEAILADPTYAQVREYLGEAHLQMGNVSAAKAQLSEIGKLCGTGCSEYTVLAAEIEKYAAKGG